MKRSFLLNLVVSTVFPSGCGQKILTTKATAEQLQKSFAKTEPAVALEVREASSALQASNYTQAVVIMNRVVQKQTIDESQKQAVDALIIQTRQAIQRDPKLDSPQLYQALSDLLTRVHGEN